MASILRISDAATLALHALVLLAQAPGRLLPAGEMAARLRVSEAHLAKVMQRLAKRGFVTATRGPKGGYALALPADAISLLDAYEAIEGRLVCPTCLMGTPVCGGKSCMLGGLLASVATQVRDYLAATKVADMADEPTTVVPAGRRSRALTQ